ncbi:MAG: primosomal protein N' [Gammaproteobacteria bacterium]|nr:primosomal protein N' [Gammaproteobacteria bacterium]MBU1600430.1 primosomal protein N' [Gammaproteobacteria bacterium]MBU2434886.1 primosomal protein N' [Gammaproteobacteria bacterium]MBU2448122.1 primosomal protein N' [Gammaproteobacteria bacterium]
MPVLRVALDLPLHRLFDYVAETASTVDIGYRVRVPFGRGEKIGVIVDVVDASDWPLGQLKPAGEILRDLPALPPDFFRLCEFASTYYQAALGEVVLQALPVGLKRLDPPDRRKGRASRKAEPIQPPALTDEQTSALAAIDPAAGFSVHLLHGVTGSGKTEVYLRLVEKALSAGRQALLLVPEINLTPQLEGRVRARFPDAEVVSLHSELAEAARERNWRAAFAGEASIVLGTRLSIFTPLPRLGLIVIDEEHDPSFKQQDGMRYSARDVGVFRAHQLGIPILLGSATPSLESWANAQGRRYGLLTLNQRANPAAKLPAVHVINTKKMVLKEGVSEPLIAAIKERLARGEQSLVFLNRRGYAPVLACPACGWISRCTRCAANMVLHLADRRLRCHHCGCEHRVPKACPTCGNQDIHPFGRGTQRLEAWLQEQFPEARVLRVDRDSVKSRKQWEAMLELIHGGQADILVGTQMLAKGHDFPKLTLVGALGADAALYAADWRAPERLFAQLMQVAGRAGRAELKGEVLIQTEYPDHPLFAALVEHDYPGFAAQQLKEREQAGFPPYAFQAVLRAEAPEMADSIAFLNTAATLPLIGEHENVMIYDPVPMKLARLANLERGQLLAESASRPALQNFLPRWREAIDGIKAPSKLRWHIEVDPLEF